VEEIGGKYYYYWLGDALYIGVFEGVDAPLDPSLLYPEDADPTGHGKDGVLLRVTEDPGPVPNAPILVATGTLSIAKSIYGAPPFNDSDIIVVGLDVPVFEGSHYYETDVPIKPSGLNVPSVVLTGPRNVQHITLGADIIIQVTKIYQYED
jgi:hypothetical protein